MVTVALFRLAQNGITVGHVRILREHGKAFHAVVSYKDQADASNTLSYRAQTDSRQKLMAAVLNWADRKFGSNCSLKPLKSTSRYHQALA